MKLARPLIVAVLTLAVVVSVPVAVAATSRPGVFQDTVATAAPGPRTACWSLAPERAIRRWQEARETPSTGYLNNTAAQLLRAAAVAPAPFVAVDERLDLAHQIRDAAERAPLDGTLAEQTEPPLHLVQPGRVGGREVQVEARPRSQPPPDLGVLVRRVVVQHEVDVQLHRHLPVDQPQERQELLVAVPLPALRQHPPGGDGIAAVVVFLVLAGSPADSHSGNVRRSDCTHQVRGTNERHRHTRRPYCPLRFVEFLTTSYPASAGGHAGSGSPGVPGAIAPQLVAAAAAQLPPEIMLDGHLLRAEDAVRQRDPAAARAAMNQIEALQEQHELDAPATYHYRYASVWNALGAWDQSLASADTADNEHCAVTNCGRRPALQPPCAVPRAHTVRLELMGGDHHEDH